MRLVPLAAAALAAGLTLAGCSAPATAPAPAAPPAVTAPATPTPTTPTPTAVAPGGQVDTGILDDIAEASAKVTSAATEMTMTTTSGGKSMVIKATGHSDYSDPASPKMAMDMTLGDQPMKLVISGEDMYMNMAALGDKWMKLTKEEMAKTGASVPTFGNEGAKLKLLKPAVKQITFVGDETVNGVSTKHYRMTVDGQEFGKATGTQVPASIQELPYDLWVGADDLVHKMRMDMAFDGGGSLVEATVGEFNKPVTITVPDPSQVTKVGG